MRRAGDREAAARPATPRSSPASSASRAWSGVAGALDIARRHPAAGRRRGRRRSRSTRTPRTRERRVAADREERAALATWTGPGRHRRRHRRSSSWPTSPTAPSARRGRPRRRSRASGLFRTELCFLDRKDEPTRRGAGRHLRARCSAPFGARPVRRGAHPRRRLRQADRLRDARGRGEPRARRPRAAAVASTTPACWSGSSTASPLAAERTGTETWVMAPMVATVAEARGVRRQGPRARAQGRRDGRDPERRAAGAPDARGRRLPVDRHQRPDPVHDGRRPDGHRPRPPHRPLAAGRAAADRDHRRGRASRPASRSGSAARPPPTRCWPGAGRHGHHVAVDGLGRRTPGRRPARPRSRMDACEDAAEAALAAGDPMAARDAVRAVLGV